MCQLNLYIIPKNVATKDIINIFQKHNLSIREVRYYKIDGLEENYTLYSTNGQCDCNSTISKLQNENINTFDAYKIKKKEEDIKKLNRMKKLKSNKNYEKMAKIFQSRRDSLLDIVDGFRKDIRNYETEELERLSALNLKDDELSKILREIVYPKMDEMYSQLNNNKEYKNASQNFQDFMNENNDINDSIYFNIEEFEKEMNEYDFSNFFDEFNSFKSICSEILKLSDEISIYPFWQDEELLKIQNKRELTFENLNINDLVFLPYGNLLKIIPSINYFKL